MYKRQAPDTNLDTINSLNLAATIPTFNPLATNLPSNTLILITPFFFVNFVNLKVSGTLIFLIFLLI